MIVDLMRTCHPTKSMILFLQLFYVKDGSKLGAFFNIKLRKNIGKVGFNGTFLNKHSSGNFLVGVAICGKPGDLNFLLGKVVKFL